MVTSDTPLIAKAESIGASSIHGLRMLLHQAVEQFRLFTGEKDAPVDAMEKALYSVIG